MRITEGQLRQIIREELLQDATLADVEPELASMQRDYDTSQSQDPQDDPHIYAGKKRHIANRRDTKRLWNKLCRRKKGGKAMQCECRLL
jgi:hypothetical protein